MPLIYSFVARGTTVLADYTAYTGNFSVVAIQALEKGAQGNNAKFTYSCDGHTFNYLSSQGYTFLIVADEAFGRQIPFAFLERVRDEWFSKWADKGAAATAHSLDKSFGARLRHWMEYCETHPDEVSKVAAVQKKVDEVKGIMVENIERVLERGEKIELLVDKTDNLRFQADKFHKTGRALRSRMWWQNFKIQIIVVLVVILLAVIIFVSVCFSVLIFVKSNLEKERFRILSITLHYFAPGVYLTGRLDRHGLLVSMGIVSTDDEKSQEAPDGEESKKRIDFD